MRRFQNVAASSATAVVLLFFFVGAMLSIAVGPVAAADQVVTSTADDGGAGTLRAAITSTNSSGGGTIAIGVTGTITLASSLPAMTQSTTIVGLGTGSTIINTAGYSLVNSTSTVDIVLRDLTITGNTSTARGAIVLHVGGTTKLERVEVTGNVGATSGFNGAIYQQQRGVLTVTHSSVHDNVGGILSNDHGNTPSNDSFTTPLADTGYDNRMYIDNTTFDDNTGCVVYTARFVAISDSSFTDNSGVCIDGLNRKSITNSTFSNNSTAITLGKNATWVIPLTIDSVTISGSTIAISGAYSETRIINSTMCSNGTDLTYRSDSNNPQVVTFTNSHIGGSCPPPPTTSTTAPPTTTSTAPPSTTVPPPTTTTAPPTTSPAPGPLDPSTLPAAIGLTTGLARVVDPSGQAVDVEVRVVDGRSVIEASGLAVTVGSPMRSGAAANIELKFGRQIDVQGSGFLAGSLVRIMLYSTPTILADVTAGADGTFQVLVDTPDAPAGAHTIVISGTRADGEQRAVSLGVEVLDTPDALAFTGSTPRLKLLAALALIGLGAPILARSRRPKSA